MRAGLPALALSADSAVVSAWSNDVGFENIFARQVEAFGRPEDVLIGLSTSGRSRNVIEAFETARLRGLRSVAVLGGDGGEVRHLSDVAVVVPVSDTQRVQEVQMVILHLLCELVEERLFPDRREEMGGVDLRLEEGKQTKPSAAAAGAFGDVNQGEPL